MKRIGVVTYWNSQDNYGQVLQCYALQQYLIKNGFEAFLIKYCPSYKDSIFRKIKRNLSAKKILYFLSKERKIQKAKDAEQQAADLRILELAKQCRFDEFRQLHIKSTKCIYTSIEELQSDPPEADAYICGSDQVWNNDLLDKNTAGWFLRFGEAKRISYAASLGRALSEKEQRRFSKYLKDFKAVSVREHTALECCISCGRTDAKVTIDPTILLGAEGFQELLSAPYSAPCNNMFIYALNIQSPEELFWDDVEQLATQEKLAIQVCCSSGYVVARDFIPGHTNEHLTVEGWLEAVRRARFVLTTSFHGTVFCLLMHVPFATIPLKGQYAKANDRIQTLLSLVGLEDRLVFDGDCLKKLYVTDIDWQKVDGALEKARQESRDWLNEALNGI